MTAYNIARTVVSANGVAADFFRVGFGTPAQNDEIVRAAVSGLEAVGEMSGTLALINGPVSLPAALVIGHALSHRYGAVACFDPKMGGYVVAVAHGGDYAVGDMIPADSVADAA